MISKIGEFVMTSYSKVLLMSTITKHRTPSPNHITNIHKLTHELLDPPKLVNSRKMPISQHKSKPPTHPGERYQIAEPQRPHLDVIDLSNSDLSASGGDPPISAMGRHWAFINVKQLKPWLCA